MKITETALPGMLILEPKVHRDARGFFLESYNERAMEEVGIRQRFVQDNHSFSPQCRAGPALPSAATRQIDTRHSW
jgi:dTDP-4-dehydrorhamnose 3,5-epimerase